MTGGNPVGLVEFLQQRMVDQIALLRQVQAQAVTDRVDPADPRFPALSLARTVEADIAAKRRIIELHHPDPAKADTWYWLQRECAECKGGWHKWLPDKLPTDIGPEQGCRTLRLLAAPFSSHPDWQPEWSVE